jgi:hypothetical protein
MRTYRYLAAVVVISGFASVASAGTITNFWCFFPDDPNSTHHTWDFNYDAQALSLEEALDHFQIDAVEMHGQTDGTKLPTVFHVTKTVQNTTTLPWIGYQLELIPGAVSPEFVAGTGTSDIMTLNLETPTLLEFVEPQQVPVGGFVTFDFDIMIPDGAAFDFTLRQTATPLPEPASLLLLAVAGLIVRRR